MFTDMVGYTGLGQLNEALSLALVDEQRKLVRPLLARLGKRSEAEAILASLPSYSGNMRRNGAIIMYSGLGNAEAACDLLLG